MLTLLGTSSAESLHKFRDSGLVVLVWRGKPWFPVSLRMLHRRIPAGIELTSNLNPILTMPHLAIWNISGRDTKTNNFQRMLQYSYLAHGGPRQTRHMIPCLENGITGVLNGNMIPFQDLKRHGKLPSLPVQRWLSQLIPTGHQSHLISA